MITQVTFLRWIILHALYRILILSLDIQKLFTRHTALPSTNLINIYKIYLTLVCTITAAEDGSVSVSWRGRGALRRALIAVRPLPRFGHRLTLASWQTLTPERYKIYYFVKLYLLCHNNKY